MLKVGDTVKVINGTTMPSGERKEFIPIGTICRVVKTEYFDGEGNAVGIIPESSLSYNEHGEFWYLEDEVEKGHMEWVKE